jgi:ABC-type Mn2+/Zn2+ transport system ATPase subunit
LKKLLELSNLEVGYEGHPILKPIDLKIHTSEIWGIVGHNGAGKTTFLKTLLGVLKPVGGEIRHPLGRPPKFGYVPQADSIDRIFPVTGREMVALGRAARFGSTRRQTPADKAAVEKALSQVAAHPFAGRPFRDLSGGQKQRILLARALATEPEILVLDEPISGMDLAGETAIMELIRDLDRDADMSILMISHALSVLANYIEHLMIVDKIKRAVLHGTVAEMLKPDHLSRLYGLDIAIEEIWEQRVIFVDRRKKPRGEAEGAKAEAAQGRKE